MLPCYRKLVKGAWLSATAWPVIACVAFVLAAAGSAIGAGPSKTSVAADHWAFRRIERPAVPAVIKAEAERRARTPVDAFIMTALARKGVSPGPEADRATLLRRVTFDLIGLPPEPEDLARFLADPSADAYARVVERLLASPHYGERWGKYWLDVAGYADSNGYFNADSDRPFAYRYRDYVVRAVNSDKPFDEFVREQLAGDELFSDMPGKPLTKSGVELLTATHFLRNGQDGTSESDGNPDERRTDRATALQGTLQITMNALCGVTIQCARCHDHKFEPVSQADYYRLQSVFYPAFPAYDPDHWVKPIDRVRDLPQEDHALSRSAPPARPTAKKIKPKKKHKPTADPGTAKLACATDVLPKPPPLHILKRGNYDDLGATVVPAGLTVLCDGPPELRVTVPYAGSRSTGRRLAFARWLTDPHSRASSLLARVMVNRIWQRHFGTGIVATPDNFGLAGAVPTNRDLLEYLADAFRRSGWSFKAMHRLIVLSAVYRQSSAARPKGLAADPDNRLLWRFPLLRLDAEALHDAMLAFSGELSERLYGPYVPTERADDGSVVPAGPPEGIARRGIYLQQHRTQVATMLELFDAPVMVNNCAYRSTSTVPLQSLALLNSNFVRQRAAARAARLPTRAAARAARLPARAPAGDELRNCVHSAIGQAFGREATVTEERASLAFLAEEMREYRPAQRASQKAWSDFCQMLMASNAFLYIE